MRTYIFLPPVKKPSGGVAVLRRLAEVLHRAGFETALVPREPGVPPESGPDAAPVVPWDALHLTPDDLWVVPEGWVNALAPGLGAKARCLVYVQNQAYLFSSLPENVTWDRLDVSFLAVSDPVARFVEAATGRPAPVLRPALDLERFVPPPSKPEGPVTVACMPRKNRADLALIRQIFVHRNGPDRVRFTELHGLDAAGVAEALRASHVYLATGYPEGLGLPPLEAMACGCLPVGFAGFGGWDYMRPVGQGCPSAPPLRDVPWSGNGLWCADGDALCAALALERAVGWWETGAPELSPALAAGQQTARSYSPEVLGREAPALWRTLAEATGRP